MGGTVPLGYDRNPDPLTRELVVNAVEAQTVETVFRLYDAFGSLRRVLAEAAKQGLRTKRHVHRSGAARGGGPLGRGQLHYLLTNPVYLGRIRHKDKVWPGRHPAIIDEDLWNRVQAKLVAASQRPRSTARTEDEKHHGAAILAGKFRDETGDRLTPSHTLKNKRRYSYYVSNRLISGGTDPTGWRLPATELEDLVTGLVSRHLEATADRHATLARPEAKGAMDLEARFAEFIGDLRQTGNRLMSMLLVKGTIAPDCVTLDLDTATLSERLGVAAVDLAPDLIRISAPLQLRRRGVEARLVSGKRKPNTDRTILKALSSAHRWAASMRGGMSIAEIAVRENKGPSYIRSRARLALLSPAIQTRIVQGTLPPDLTLERLLRIDLPLDWIQQRQALEIQP